MTVTPSAFLYSFPGNSTQSIWPSPALADTDAIRTPVPTRNAFACTTCGGLLTEAWQKASAPAMPVKAGANGLGVSAVKYTVQKERFWQELELVWLNVTDDP